jgi:hypothetical protein
LYKEVKLEFGYRIDILVENLVPFPKTNIVFFNN